MLAFFVGVVLCFMRSTAARINFSSLCLSVLKLCREDCALGIDFIVLCLYELPHVSSELPHVSGLFDASEIIPSLCWSSVS